MKSARFEWALPRRLAPCCIRLGLISLLPLLSLPACSPRVSTIGEQVTDAAAAGLYIEAESGTLSGGFAIGEDATASGGHVIYSKVGSSSDTVPGPARATYELVADVAGDYVVWGRLHTQNIYQNRLWFQVDDGDWVKWRITTGDIWFWDGLHDNLSYGIPYVFQLSTGVHRLSLANDVDGAELDRLYFAPRDAAPPSNDTLCNPPHTVDLDGGCAPSCGDLGGHCGSTNCVNLPVIVATYDCPACCTP